MEKQGSGRIVFITSISAYTASVNRGEYCISKAGLSMSVALYAQRLAAHGITVFEDSARHHQDGHDRRGRKDIRRKDRRTVCCLNAEWEKASDIAKAVRAIADGLLDYSTGQILNLDGGFHLRSL